MVRFFIFYFLFFSSTILLAQNRQGNIIIKKVIALKKQNNTQDFFKNYTNESYSKIVFTTNYTSKNTNKNTSKLKRDLAKRHFFIAEKKSLFEYNNKKEKETIQAVKMAGFKEPVYEFFTLALTKINLYNNRINLLGTDYVSPLSKTALHDYDYTILEETDSVYEILFESKKRKKSIGLMGVLIIDKKSFALRKNFMEIDGQVNVKVNQDYTFYNNENHWFLNNTKIILTKGKSQKLVKTFRKLIGYSDLDYKDKFKPEDISFIKIETDNKNVVFNNNPKIKNSDYAIYLPQEAITREKEKWTGSNLFTHSKKDNNTYLFLDSIVQNRKVERKLNFLRTLSKGKLATKWLDIDLSQIATFNNHEGFRLGFGGTTNDNLSNKFRLNGYAAFGNKDDKVKFHYGADYLILKSTNTWLGGSFTNDIHEAANPKLLFEEPRFALINPRNINISQFYTYKVKEIHIHHDLMPNMLAKLAFNTGKYKNEFDYAYITRTGILRNYTLTKVSVGVEWTPLSKYMQTPKGKFSVQKKLPKINLEITKSFDNLLNGDFNYTQINLKALYKIKTIKNGSTEFLLKTGLTFGDAPLSHLFNHTPNHSLTNPWRARINFSGTNAFETMLFNEFISDKYLSIQARQNFEKFRIGKKFKPKLSFVTRFAIGKNTNILNHRGVSFKEMNKGYLEAGLVLNQLYKGLGVSGFYRLGAYHFAKAEDNLAIKITYVIDLF